MNKFAVRPILNLYERDSTTGETSAVINPKCEWVYENIGIAVAKLDSLLCRIKKGKLYRLHTRKFTTEGRVKARTADSTTKWDITDYRPFSENWEQALEPDPATGKWVGWTEAVNTSQYKYMVSALAEIPEVENVDDELCELIGPQINNNPHRVSKHLILPFGLFKVDIKRDRATFIKWMESHPRYEGIIFIHNDHNFMAKITRKELGLAWPPPKTAITRPNINRLLPA